MSRTGDSFGKRDVKSKKDQKRKEKEKKRLERKDTSRKNSPDDMIAYVDENGMITSERPDPDKKTVISVEDIVISPPKKTELTEADLERKGKLTSFIQSKGYGFIRASDSQESFFAHIKDFMEEINEGDTVMFQVMRGPKGYSAVKVRLCPK
jgi:cold shock CspA family protein